ncbi:T9SS type A sorting domain-containing protein [Flavobacterium kingsejongi]|uniref:Secretion protein n=1 Tax=Flavobacterium kingsejongi TaxID=1678728 RepID=A0A2S1LMH4_9FLAO|nr:T9SS type A sorting domain-containing protein [Flavobacterium kingsejongi]AWG24960.1 secretion protein [Flavobacterium kingsejongi]
MTKNYFYILFFLLFISLPAAAQEGKTPKNQDNTIEGLNFYPNPVSNGKIYITSKSASNKDVEIFDVLGKKVFQSSISAKELNISSLVPGVYIIKIKEGDMASTRKLIVK